MKTRINPEVTKKDYNILHDLSVNNIYMAILIQAPNSDFNHNFW